MHDPVTWYGVIYAGTQVTQHDFKNKRTCTSPARVSFVPLRILRSSIMYSAPCDHVKGLFLLTFCFFFFFLALPNPSFYNFLDIFSSLVDPYRPVPSLVLALPFPARISPSSVLSYHTLLYPPSLNLAFSPSLLVYIFAVFHSIDPRHNEC